MQEKNLVVLMYAMNNCYVQAVDVPDAKKCGLELNIEKAQWSYCEWKNTPIGQRRAANDPKYGLPCKEGIIGVYDRTSTTHLNTMLHDATEAVDSGGSIDVDAL